MREDAAVALLAPSRDIGWCVGLRATRDAPRKLPQAHGAQVGTIPAAVALVKPVAALHPAREELAMPNAELVADLVGQRAMGATENCVRISGLALRGVLREKSHRVEVHAASHAIPCRIHAAERENAGAIPEGREAENEVQVATPNVVHGYTDDAIRVAGHERLEFLEDRPGVVLPVVAVGVAPKWHPLPLVHRLGWQEPARQSEPRLHEGHEQVHVGKRADPLGIPADVGKRQQVDRMLTPRRQVGSLTHVVVERLRRFLGAEQPRARLRLRHRQEQLGQRLQEPLEFRQAAAKSRGVEFGTRDRQ
mmetsp:Transcript_103219/g.291468  ORF Transcript_103219/g.291468 Transcript_103219/m.291468 type:complete len:307 (-) Transcript_103219:366-1286(-)